MGGIGFVLGAGLSYASKKFAVEKNAKVEEIEYDNTNAASIVDYKITCKIQLSESDS